MIISALILAGWSFVDFLNWSESQGFFKYLLPLLLIFALVFGILSKTRMIGDNKGAIAIIAFALGSLSLYGDYLPNFFAEFAPLLGVGLSVFLAGVILMGFFFDSEKLKWLPYVFFGLGTIIFLFVIIPALQGGGFRGGYFWNEYGNAIITLLIIIGLIIAVVVGGKSKNP